MPLYELKCPCCGGKVEWKKGEKLPLYFPFCSLRCKLIDLGYWLEEKYAIPYYGKEEKEKKK